MPHRTRDRRERRDDRRTALTAELQMTPMIDVTFLLLVFFLCTLRFQSLEGKLAAFLPKDVGPNPTEALVPDEPIRVTLEVAHAGERLGPRGGPWDGAGRYVLSADRELRYRVGPRAVESRDGLRTRLAELHGLTPDRDVVLDVRPGVVQAEAVGVLDDLFATGFASVRFAAADPR